VWLVELADPGLVPQAVATAAGLREEPGWPLLAALTDALRPKRLLLVLDNCEHLLDACARLADAVLRACPHVQVLATSREPLGVGGEVTWRVPSLALPDGAYPPPVAQLTQCAAVRLFVDRAVAVLPAFRVTNQNAPAVAQICHRLDGIPLAIELAAAKLRMLGVEQIAKRLDDRFRLLTGGSRTALERHQTLRAAIDWSYNLLPSTEQILFRRLSVFVGGWTLEAAEAVGADQIVKDTEIMDLLGQLINKSLVVMEDAQRETKYRILETMRQYANEKLVEAEESDILRDRHLEYFLNLAETAEPHLTRPEQLEWLAKLDADYENLRLALEWALNKESAELSLRLCAALGDFWFLRCYWLEGLKWLDRALAKPVQPSKTEKMLRVKALCADALLANELDDLPRMKTSAEKSSRLAQETSGRREIAIARLCLGWALRRQNEDERALDLMEQSFRDFQEMSDLFWKAKSYRIFSDALAIQGKLTWKEAIYRTVELARAAGERVELAIALLDFGAHHFMINQPEEARKYAEEASELLKQIGSNVADAEFLFASMAWLKGDYKEAKALYMVIQTRLGLLGERNVRSAAIGTLGSLALEEGDFGQARRFLEESLATSRELQNNFLTVIRLIEIGNLFYLEGYFDEFKQKYREGLSLAKKLNVAEKFHCLFFALRPLENRATDHTVYVLGALHHSHIKTEIPVDPIVKRFYDRAEVYARRALSNTMFESLFVEGEKLSLDQAIDLLLKNIEDM
jgi:non-specific serine/threonine protein kinase